MRTTINLDDDVASIVRQYAESRSLALGKAVSELVRRGINTSRPTRTVNGLLVVDLPPDSPRVTTGKVRELEAEEQ
ncbi:MAG TPA: antitoxin [Candidatus Angelobacter sp.]|nr:antitoxin [Candidatus Angelobacter sp.]